MRLTFKDVRYLYMKPPRMATGIFNTAANELSKRRAERMYKKMRKEKTWMLKINESENQISLYAYYRAKPSCGFAFLP